MTKELLVEPDLACETKFWTGKYHLEQGIRSLVYLPLLLRGEVFGALIVARRRPDAYEEKELTLLKQVVAQIALPVQNARLFEDTEQKRRSLTFILRITKAITSDAYFSKVFQTFTEELQSLVRFDRASITIVEGDRIRFLATSQDMPVEPPTGKTYPLKNSATGWVLENKRTLIQTDIAKYGLSLTDDIKYKAGLRSSIHVPLVSKGEIFGSLNLSSREPNAYGEKEKEILEQLANQIADTIWSF